MGFVDIIYLSLVSVLCIGGVILSIKSFIDIRENSLKKKAYAVSESYDFDIERVVNKSSQLSKCWTLELYYMLYTDDSKTSLFSDAVKVMNNIVVMVKSNKDKKEKYKATLARYDDLLTHLILKYANGFSDKLINKRRKPYEFKRLDANLYKLKIKEDEYNEYNMKIVIQKMNEVYSDIDNSLKKSEEKTSPKHLLNKQ